MVCRLAFGLILRALLIDPLLVAQDSRAPAPPTEKEIALGRALAAELETEAGLLNDAAVVEFVESIAQELAEASGTQTFLTVRVLDSPEAAAHSLPSGFLLVRSGLVANVETAAGFAGVVAHEIAHIAAGHGERHTSEPNHMAVSSVPKIYLGGWMGFCTRFSGGLSFPLGFLERAGRQEEEADLLALEYLDRADYDPNALVDAFDRLRQDTPEIARVASAVREKAREYSPTGRSYMITSSAFDAIRDRLPSPTPQQQVENAPSLRRPAER